MNNKIFFSLVVLIFISSCEMKNEENKGQYKATDYLKRLEFIKEIRLNNFNHSIEISETINEYYRIDDLLCRMKDKIEKAIKNEEESIDLNDFFMKLKKQDYIDCSFWKTSKVDIETSLYLLERLFYELGQSDLCNDYYLFDNVSIQSQQIGKNKYKLNWDVNSLNYREDIVIKSKLSDSIIRYESFDVDKKTTEIKLEENEKLGGIVFRKINSESTLKMNGKY